MKRSFCPMLSRAGTEVDRSHMRRSRREVLRALSAIAAGAMLPGFARAEDTAIAPAGLVKLVNGAAAAGLNFVLRNDAHGRKYQVETLPGGLAVIDFDGDGWPDLFCSNGAALPTLTKSGPEFWNRLYRNNHDGTFSDVTEKAGLQGRGYNMGVAVGDYNNDGHEDIFDAGDHENI